jgi:hypothetical protein
MKKYPFLILFIFILGIQAQFAQVLKNYDSVSIFQKKYNKNKFVLNPPLFQSLSITQKKPKRATYSSDEVLEDIGRVGLTILLDGLWGEYTETSIGDTDEVDWVLSSFVECKNPAYDWNIQIFTRGMHFKGFSEDYYERNSRSEREVWWDDGVTGIVLHQKDTISRFVFFDKPDINLIIEKMDPQNFENHKIDIMNDLNKTFNQGSLFLWNMDYALIGKFKGDDFSVVCSEQAGKFWIFKNGIAQAILELPKKPVFAETKNSEERNLLIRRENQKDTLDFVRLSLLYYYFRYNI